MAGNDGYFVWKCEEGVMDGLNQFPSIASGKIGATYGTGKKCVSGEQQGLLGEVKADATLSMAGSVEDSPG